MYSRAIHREFHRKDSTFGNFNQNRKEMDTFPDKIALIPVLRLFSAQYRANYYPSTNWLMSFYTSAVHIVNYFASFLEFHCQSGIFRAKLPPAVEKPVIHPYLTASIKKA